MDLQIPITLTDELSDEVIQATGVLDMASGEIRDVAYEDYDVVTEGLPAARPDYEFTSGMISSNGRDVEFGVTVQRGTGRYSVTPDELLEIKKRAAVLFTRRPD